MNVQFPEIDQSILCVEFQGWLASLDLRFSDENFIEEKVMTRYMVLIYDALVLKIDIIPKVINNEEMIRFLFMDDDESSYPLISVHEREANMFMMKTSFKQRLSDPKFIELAKIISVDIANYISTQNEKSKEFHDFFKLSKYYNKKYKN